MKLSYKNVTKDNKFFTTRYTNVDKYDQNFNTNYNNIQISKIWFTLEQIYL